MITIQTIRKHRVTKFISIGVLFTFLFDIIHPSGLQAHNQSPFSSDFSGFTGASQRNVNPFTGDFSYSIPLVSIGGKNLNLNYDANVSMEQDAGWVGLGWSLNPGAINRNLRGVPDDFIPESDIFTQTDKVANRNISSKSTGQSKTFNANVGVGIGAGSNYGAGVGIAYVGNRSNWIGPYKDSWLGKTTESSLRKGHSWIPSVSANLGPLGVSSNVAFFNGKFKYFNSIKGNTYSSTSGKTYSSGVSLSTGANLFPGNSGMNVAAGGGIGASIATTSSNTQTSNTRAGFLGSGKSRSSDFGVGISAGLYLTKSSDLKKDGGDKGKLWQKLTNKQGKNYYGLSLASAGASSSFNINKSSIWKGYARSVSIPRINTNSIASGNTDWNQYTTRNISVGGSATFFGIFYVSAGVGYSEDAITDKKESDQGIVSNSGTGISIKSVGARGFLSGAPGMEDNAIHDFIREKERPLNSEINQNLPVPIQAHDIFNSSAMGDQFTFRAYKYVPEVNVEKVTHNSGKTTIKSTVENDDRSLYTDGTVKNSGQSSNWHIVEGNKVGITLSGALDPNYKTALANAIDQGFSDTHFEPFYFKSMDEPEKFDQAYYDQFGGINLPSKYKMTSEFIGNLFTNGKLYGKLNGDLETGSKVQNTNAVSQKSERILRNRCITPHNGKFAKLMGYQPTIEDWEEYTGNSGATSKTDIDRESSAYPDHHINEYEVVNEDGSKYIYGLPVYNRTTEEYIFNINTSNINTLEGLCQYDVGDNSTANANGKETYFQKKVTPEYTTSHLLTEILSENYQDLEQDGPTRDDLGNYIKFNYSKIYDNFKWRSPMCYRTNSNSAFDYNRAAHFIEGLRSDDSDDKASYTYGEKEIWYLHSIESKDLIVEFYISDRVDAYGVSNTDGGQNTSQALKKLDSLKVFNKIDREENGANANLLKRVEFEYDYSLCADQPGNSGASVNGNTAKGKLTLKKVYITKGASLIGMTTPYVFHYGSNPDFAFQSSDGWGNYKPNTGLGNLKYPFSEQDSNLANSNVKAWKMDSIDFPGGASMKVEYEVDRYRSIQDKDPMKMVKITGDPSTGIQQQYTVGGKPFTKPSNANRTLYLTLEDSIVAPSQALAKDTLKKYFLRDLANGEEEVYISALVDFGNNVHEQVDVFGFIEDYGVSASVGGKYPHAWITLKNMNTTLQQIYKHYRITNLGDNPQNGSANIPYGKLSPVCHFAFQFARNYLYDHLYLSSASKKIPEDMKSLASGMTARGFAKFIDTEESFIRLYEPDNEKIGGTHRVKSITYYDGWGKMVSSGNTHVYGNKYTYNHRIASDSSSGVVTYLPQHEKRINPYFNIIWEPWESVNFTSVDEDNIVHSYEKVITLLNYDTEPYGEALYPAPSHGYHRVQENELTFQNVTKNTRGFKEYHFHTASSHPFTFKKTDPSGMTTIKLENPVGSNPKNYNASGGSQGFLIQTNNWHGLPDKEITYNASNIKTSSSEYHYLNDGFGNFTNEVYMIDKDGSVSNETLGIRAEMWADFYETYGKTKADHITKSYNRIKLLSKVKRAVGIKNSKPRKRKGKTAQVISTDLNHIWVGTFVKTVSKRAILDYVVQNGPNTSTRSKTHAYDYLTGNPILSSSTNEFRNDIFSFSQPAHWAYKDLSLASINTGLIFDATVSSNTVTLTNGDTSKLNRGDEVFLLNSDGTLNSTNKYWLLNFTSATQVQLIDKNGSIPNITLTGKMMVVRSSRANMPLTPIEQITCKQNPISNGSSLDIDKVINASATVLSQHRSITKAQIPNSHGIGGEVCNNSLTISIMGCLGINSLLNPFLYNIQGDFKPHKAYAYRSRRAQWSTDQKSTDIKEDGLYPHFTPFWVYDSGTGFARNATQTGYDGSPVHYVNWKIQNEVTRMDNFNRVLEQKNVLNQHSSTLFGYNYRQYSPLAVAQASNARLHQIASETFEGHDYGNQSGKCYYPGHWSFKGRVADSYITNDQAHTGDYSLYLCPGSGIPTYAQMTSLVYGKYAADTLMSSDNDQYLDASETNPIFAPEPGDYYFSAWTATAEGSDFVGDLSSELIFDHNPDVKVRFTYLNSAGTEIGKDSCSASGSNVDGWQKIEGRFTIPSLCHKLKVELLNEHSFNTVYFDDIRMHPIRATMQTMVYSNKDLRLRAVLDENNFATHVNYNQSFQQVGNKIETEKGVLSSSESRSFRSKQ